MTAHAALELLDDQTAAVVAGGSVVSVCRSCGAPIVWATVRTSGRRIPLDAEPSSAGNVLLHSDGTCQVLIRGLQIAVAGATWHTSHLATCHADHHRKMR